MLWGGRDDESAPSRAADGYPWRKNIEPIPLRIDRNNCSSDEPRDDLRGSDRLGGRVYHERKRLDLFMAHRGGLVNYANGIVRDHARAEDVVQEAWLKFVAPTARQFPEEPVGYLYRIVRNLAIDARRRIGREERYIVSGAEAETAQAPDELPSPAAVAEACDELRAMRAAMAELPDRTRIALEMHRFGDVRLQDIADHLGISLGLTHRIVIEGLEHCRARLCRR